MSSEIFETLDEDLQAFLNTIRRKIEVDIPRVFGEERKKTVRDVEREFENVYATLDEMDGEVRKAPQPYRSQMNAKVKNRRDEINQLSLRLRQLTSSGNSSLMRDQLLSGDRPLSSSDVISEQRSSVIQTNSMLDRTSQSIARSHQVAIETEEIGHGIMSEMGEQRETLTRARDHLAGTDANLIQSRKILKSMYQRAITNKLVLIFIILLEVAILIGIIYWKFFS